MHDDAKLQPGLVQVEAQLCHLRLTTKITSSRQWNNLPSPPCTDLDLQHCMLGRTRRQVEGQPDSVQHPAAAAHQYLPYQTN